MKIIVTEDDSAVAQIMLMRLGMEGHDVKTFPSADPAWLMIRANPQDCDLLITDVEMPGTMTGLELCLATKLLRPEILVIVMSSNTCYDVNARIAKADDFLTKPFSMDWLAVSIKSLVGNLAII